MKISPYSAIGRRTNNEDFLAYAKGIYIVCDGVGGSEKGEVASRFVAENLLQGFDEALDEPFNKSSIQQRITITQHALNARLIEKPEEKGMGTTLTLFALKPKGAHIAHIGDSRVYFIRPSKGEYWHTKDHSLVQELVDAGIITEAKARTHPKKNHITRAIQANAENKAVKADIVKLNEIEEGDLFFLCSDGVLEAFDDDTLIKLMLRTDLSIETKLDIIKEGCSKDSSDNNTAILLEIEAKDVFNNGANEELIMRKLSNPKELTISELDVEAENDEDMQPYILEATDIEEHTEESISKKIRGIRLKGKLIKWLFFLLVAVAGIAFAASVLKGKQKKEPEKKENTGKSVTVDNSKESNDYTSAEKLNTIAAYNQYLEKYPTGSNANKARRNIEKLKLIWKETIESNSKEAYEKYVKDFPKGDYFKAARDSITAIEKRLEKMENLKNDELDENNEQSSIMDTTKKKKEKKETEKPDA